MPWFLTSRRSNNKFRGELAAAAFCAVWCACAAITAAGEPSPAEKLAPRVTIYRDAFGVPHIDGQTDEAVMFGFAYAQAEDYFWQVEDSYILALGRYAEVHGRRGLNSDLLNRAFEIVPRAKAAYAALPDEEKSLCRAFVAGLNHYLTTHAEVKPRLIRRFEPWHPLAFGRHFLLEFTFRFTGVTSEYKPRMNPTIWSQAGSNAWAIAPSRAKSKRAMLLVNPHQPWFGFGQMYEAHLRSGEGWSLAGAAAFGSLLPSMGHNEFLGWALTTNAPDIADAWRLTFDDPRDPRQYRFGGGSRRAIEWRETIQVMSGDSLKPVSRVFRKTHYGPVVKKEDDGSYLAVRIAGLYDANLLRQGLEMARSKNLEQFQAALSLNQLPLMNVVYADRQGNIACFYTGRVPRRDPSFDWKRPLDGADPRAAWQGFHAFDELPRLINPACGYVQNCNSSPFTTTERENPEPGSFPSYMVQEADFDSNRAKMSRRLLEDMRGATFGDLKRAAFDTTIYWAVDELPKMRKLHERAAKERPRLAKSAEPYLGHLLDWDGRCTEASTQATLCEAWYRQLYGSDYPGEMLRPRYVEDPLRKLSALVSAAAELQTLHGSWKVAWGDLHRVQRHADAADLFVVPFSEDEPSLPSIGVPGPMGSVFTQYYTPSIDIPFVTTRRQRFGVVGATYLGVYEFDEPFRGATLLNFGQSGDPDSPHFVDQAKLLSERRLKPELFDWSQIKAAAVRAYRPE